MLLNKIILNTLTIGKVYSHLNCKLFPVLEILIYRVHDITQCHLIWILFPCIPCYQLFKFWSGMYTWKSVGQQHCCLCPNASLLDQQQTYSLHYYTPTQRSCWGVFWFHSVHLSVRPSVCPASRVRSVAPTVLVESISYFYILLSHFRKCVACNVSCKMSKFELLESFFKFVTLTLSCLTWDLIWINSMGNHGVAGVFSERWCSSCSSFKMLLFINYFAVFYWSDSFKLADEISYLMSFYHT